ncbi:MAG: hypothetical protein ACOC0P_04165 [Planctomycetota bacterium]
MSNCSNQKSSDALLDRLGASSPCGVEHIRHSQSGVVGRSGDHVSDTAAASFSTLIERAKNGQLGQIRSVQCAGHITLAPAHQEQLPLLTDRLEAAGSERGLVIWPGFCCTIDVRQREVTQATSPADLAREDRILTGIDAVVVARDPGEVPTADGNGETNVESQNDPAYAIGMLHRLGSTQMNAAVQAWLASDEHAATTTSGLSQAALQAPDEDHRNATNMGNGE